MCGHVGACAYLRQNTALTLHSFDQDPETPQTTGDAKMSPIVSTNNTSVGTDGNLTKSTSPGMIAETIFLCLLTLVILGGNMLVCAAFYRERKLRTTTNSFLISLAAADIMVGIFSVPFWIYFRIAHPITDSVLYKIYITYDILCGTASIINLVTISVERCLSVTQPAIHRNISDATIFISITISWLLAFVIAGLNNIEGSYKKWYPVAISIAGFFLPLFIIVVAYLIIFKVAHSRARARRSRSLSRDIRIAVTLAVVIGAFVVAWSPFFIVLLIAIYCKTCEVPYPIIVPLTKWMHYSGSMVNPFIYTYRNRDFRKAFQKVLCTWRRRRESTFVSPGNNTAGSDNSNQLEELESCPDKTSRLCGIELSTNIIPGYNWQYRTKSNTHARV